jgi:putative spermidine/putrescine transport system substrate-binding protein
MWHRFLRCVLLVCVSGLLAHCGTPAGGTNQSAAPGATTAPPTADAVEPTNASSTAQATAPAASAAADQTIVVYNTPPEWANWGTVLEQFQAASGVTVPPDNKNSGQTVAQLVAEQSQPQADAAYFGVTFGIEAANRGLLTPYKPQNWDAIPDDLKDAEGHWFTIHSGSIAFIVNTDALDGAPVPRSWDDLLKPEYKGKIGFLDPTSAFVGYAVATAANSAKGGSLDNWDPGIAYFEQLMQQEPIIPKQTATARVLSGEIPILLDYDFNGYRLKYKDNGPIEVVIPQEGSIVLPYVVGLVANGPNPEAGKQFLDYLLSDEGQRAWADGYVRPVRNELMSAETQAQFLPASEYERSQAIDYQKMAEVQPTFTERWTNEVLQ